MTTDHYRIFVLPALGVAPGYYALLVQALEQLPAQVSVLAPESPQRWRQRLLGQVQVGYGDMVARIIAANAGASKAAAKPAGKTAVTKKA